MTRRIALATAAAGLLAAPAPAADSLWNVQLGEWGSPSSWIGPVPDASGTAVFDFTPPAGPFVQFSADRIARRAVIRAGAVEWLLWHSLQGGTWVDYELLLVSPTVTEPSLVVAEGDGDVASLVISGGTVSAGTVAIGQGAGSSATLELVPFDFAGLAPQMQCTGPLHVGGAGQGTLLLGEDCGVSCQGATLAQQAASYAEVSLEAGAELHVDGQLVVAKQGQGVLSIAGAASVHSGPAIIGQNQGGDGSVSATGPGLQWLNDGSLDVGYKGNGSLSITGGAAVVTNGFATLGTLPDQLFEPTSGGVGHVTVSGPASLWLVNGDLSVGFLWTGTLEVLDGGFVSAHSVTVNPSSTLHLGGGLVAAGSLYVGPMAQMQGDGTVAGDLSVLGQLIVGDPIGTLLVDGNLSSSASLIEMDLAGPGQFDRLQVSGTAALGGTLEVSLADGFVPQPGDSFTVVDATGLAFAATLDLPALPPGLDWQVTQGTALVLSVTGPPSVPGDLDGDGVVGVIDFLALLAAWGPCPPAGQCLADLDGNGSVDTIDLLLLLAHWT